MIESAKVQFEYDELGKIANRIEEHTVKNPVGERIGISTKTINLATRESNQHLKTYVSVYGTAHPIKSVRINKDGIFLDIE